MTPLANTSAEVARNELAIATNFNSMTTLDKFIVTQDIEVFAGKIAKMNELQGDAIQYYLPSDPEKVLEFAERLVSQ